jgi:hypothetical protein
MKIIFRNITRVLNTTKNIFKDRTQPTPPANRAFFQRYAVVRNRRNKTASENYFQKHYTGFKYNKKIYLRRGLSLTPPANRAIFRALCSC